MINETLINFEIDRKNKGLIPPDHSNSFYDIGLSRIDLYTIRDDPEDYRFDLYVEKGNLVVGDGTFSVNGEIVDIDRPYNSFTVLRPATLSMSDRFIVNKGTMEVYGTVDLDNGAHLISNNGGSIIFNPNSVLNIKEGSSITVEDGAELKIYGEVNIHLTIINVLMDNPNVYIDTAAVINVDGIDLGDRDFSISDYVKSLQGVVINKYTRNEYNTEHGRVGYVWKDGNTAANSTILELDVLYGDIVLGDYKVSILGLQNVYRENLLIFESIKIVAGATLYISDSYLDQRFLSPNLYLGVVIDNVKRTANMRIDGTCIVSGSTSTLTIDRKATCYISDNGLLELRNGAHIISAYNDDTPVLFIHGTLIIDGIEQIESLDAENIVFGDDGKLIIENNYEDENKLLFSTPNGIHYTDLYRLFYGRLDKVEYHIKPNTGISIDQFFEFYSRDMTDWYGGIRIEKAIYNKMIIWHDNAFIELDHSIIPWADMDATLYQLSRIFKSYGSFDDQKLQDVVERLRYAGSGNIRFRIRDGETVKEIILNLNGLKLNNIISNTSSNSYTINSSDAGELFLHNLIPSISLRNIVNDTAVKVDLQEGDTTFILEET